MVDGATPIIPQSACALPQVAIRYRVIVKLIVEVKTEHAGNCSSVSGLWVCGAAGHLDRGSRVPEVYHVHPRKAATQISAIP